jgi:hypothetical protein
VKILLLSLILVFSLNAKEYDFIECPYHISQMYYYGKTDLKKELLEECFKRADNNLEEFLEYNYGIVESISISQRAFFEAFIKKNR